MKTCPYCAEEIKDAAIRCRWCQMWLVDDVPAGADADRPPTGAMMASDDDRPAAGVMAGAGASAASMTTADADETMTPTTAETAGETSGAAAAGAAGTTTTAAGTGTAAGGGATPTGEPKIEFTHTGSRYLLGYGGDFFGIWDRNAPQQPIERFPRNDQGWASAWQRYSSMESNWMDLRTGQKSG